MPMMTSQLSDEAKHTAAHVLAAAVKRVFPDSKIGIGPVTKDGFYYDIQIDKDPTDTDLENIQIEVDNIIKENLKLVQINLPKDEAINMLYQSGEIFKSELVQSITDSEVSFYKLGDEFIDLCRGPHLNSTGDLPIIKIVEVSKTNWKEDPTRPVMYRFYGKLFRSDEELLRHSSTLKEIRNRDYKEISVSLDLGFGEGSDFMLTNRGTSIIKIIQGKLHRYIQEDLSSDTITVTMKERPSEVTRLINSYVSSKTLSYKQLPLYFDTKAQLKSKVKDEVNFYQTSIFHSYFADSSVVSHIGGFIEKIVKTFKEIEIDISAELVSPNLEDTTVTLVSSILQNNLVSHDKVLTKTKNFLEIRILTKDTLGRTWTLGIINLHRENTPNYMNNSNEFNKTALLEMIFVPMNIFAFLVENHKGVLPEVLQPTQIMIVPINKSQHEFATELYSSLMEKNYTVEIDKRSKSMQSKIRSAESLGIPFIFVVGNKEVKNEAVSIRHENMEIGLISLENIDEYLKENME